MRDPATLTVEEVAQRAGVYPPDWEGQCYGLACAAARLLGPGAVAVYGHWLGPLSPAGFWAAKVGAPFVQHGWVNLPDGRVLDPTRWSFEAAAPYLYLGPPDYYDEGGNALRRAMLRPPPEVVAGAKTVTLVLDRPAALHVENLLGQVPGRYKRGNHGVRVTVDQAFWLANLPMDMLRPHEFAVYFAITRGGSSCWIPIDNARAVARSRGEAPDYFSELG